VLVVVRRGELVDAAAAAGHPRQPGPTGPYRLVAAGCLG
jgi:hypothetical protein